VVNNHVRRPQSIQEISALAAQAKSFAKQSTGNVYHISPRRILLNQENAYAPFYNTSSILAPALAQYAADNPHRYPDLLAVVESKTEYEQRVH
jgi:hypothetical protein